MNFPYNSILFSKHAPACLILAIFWLCFGSSLLISPPSSGKELVAQQGYYRFVELGIKGLALLSFIAILAAFMLLVWRSLRIKMKRIDKVWWVIICALLLLIIIDDLVGNVAKLFEVTPTLESDLGDYLKLFGSLTEAQQMQVLSSYRDVLSGYALVISMRGLMLASSLYLIITLLGYQREKSLRIA